jgi:hypothetical protein
LALLPIALLSMMGCSSVSAKNKREIWLIDNEALVLYRVIDDENEVAIPLSHKTASEFMCISRREFDNVVEDLVKK